MPARHLSRSTLSAAGTMHRPAASVRSTKELPPTEASKDDRSKHKKQLQQKAQTIMRTVLAKCKVSGADDSKYANRSGLLLKCQAPEPIISESTGGGDEHQILLFVDASTVLHAVQAQSGCGGYGGNTSMLEFCGKVETYNMRNSNRPASPEKAGCKNRAESPPRLECELDNFSFKAVSYLVHDYLRYEKQLPVDHPIAKPRAGKTHAALEPVLRDDAANVDEHGVVEQQRKLFRYIDAFACGQDLWAPKDQSSYLRLYSEFRVDPTVAESVYELACAFNRTQLERDSELPMLWQWGAEMRRLSWSLPPFSWLSQKLRCACSYDSAALQNFLLIYLEKKGMDLNELLTLYERVANAPIIAMHVERELTSVQIRDPGSVEWLLSEFVWCEGSKDKPVYTKTLANAFLMRVACLKPQGAAMLRTALSEVGSSKRNRIQTLETYRERYRSFLLLSNAKAHFTLHISSDNIIDPNLLQVLKSYVSSSRETTAADSNGSQKNRSDDDAEPIIFFEFDLCRSSTDFAIELARALNILTPVNADSITPTKAADDKPSRASSSSTHNEKFDKCAKSPTNRSRSRQSRTASASQQSAAEPHYQRSPSHASSSDKLKERHCKFINWQFVEIKQIVKNSTAADDETDDCGSSSLYARAQQFHSLPFAYVPNELPNLKTFRPPVKLEHPMICMLLHTLYDNDETNLLGRTVETVPAPQKKTSRGRPSHRVEFQHEPQAPTFHFRIRLTAKSISQLFSREWQANELKHRDTVKADDDGGDLPEVQKRSKLAH